MPCLVMLLQLIFHEKRSVCLFIWTWNGLKCPCKWTPDVTMIVIRGLMSYHQRYWLLKSKLLIVKTSNSDKMMDLNFSVNVLQIVILLVKMLHSSLKLLDDGFVLLDVLILLQNCWLLVFNDILKFLDFIVNFQAWYIFLAWDWGWGGSEERGRRLCQVRGGDGEASLQGRGSAQDSTHPTQPPLTLIWHHPLFLLTVDKHLRRSLMKMSNKLGTFAKSGANKNSSALLGAPLFYVWKEMFCASLQ